MKLIKKIAAAALSAGLVAPQGARAALVSARANAGTGAAPAFAPAALGQLGLPAPSATGLDGTLSVTTGIDLAAPSPSIGAAASALAPIGAAAADQTAPEPGAVRTSAPDVAPTDGRRAAQEHVSAVAQQVGDIGKGFANARSSEAGFGSGLALQAAVTGERFSAAPGGAEPTAAPANAFVAAYREQFARAVIGQTAMRDAMLLALLAGGHVLLEGNPGVAKTRSVLTLGEMTELSAKRIQFTRDLQPFDITGQEEKDRHTEKWDIRRGPIFNNLVLADEINRAKPQTQGALLEAMEEGRVTIAGQTLDLPQPFMVLATQNNLNDAGTYPLPSAQLDRFMFKIRVPNLSEAELAQMLSLLSQDKSALSRVITREGLLEARARAAKVKA
ncbi:MAG TPA: AAA family ATPase, partial [Elusimicrobiota bacterium]|nr:AAA family ATPase [Elusimicrobiota bacterium]